MGRPHVNVGKGFYLSELIARYIAEPFLADNPTVDVAEIRPRLGQPRGGALTIVVVDGSAGLTERAPLALLDAGEETHQLMEKLLAGGPHALHDDAEKRNSMRWLPKKTVG